MQAYNKYKNSNVDWLGQVPEHWEVENSKWLFALRNEKAQQDDEMLTASQKYGMISQKKFMELENQNVMQVIKNADILKHIEAGDFVISMRSFQGGLEYSSLSGAVSSAYVALVPNEKVVHEFYKYLFKSPLFIQALQSTSNLVRDGQALRYNNFIQIRLPLPPIDEQEYLAKFLRKEVARIDSLISEKERFITLLEEKRQALISHVVTKGLDDKVEMKDSGVEWIGAVPKHWVLNRLKQNLKKPMMYGANESAEDENPEHPRYIRITDMRQDGSLKDSTFKSLKPNIAAPYILDDGDVLLARSGATVGKSFIYSSKFGACCFAGYLIKVSVNRRLLLPEFLYYVTNSHFYWEYIAGSQIQATIQNVSAEKYANLPIPLPPIEEQQKIIVELEKTLSKLNSIADEVQSSIKLLKEHRSALISAAVTGKIDIREEV